MDGLSAGASAIAVVSIAIQLTDSIKKFADFIESIKEAPEDVESDFSDLRNVSSMLEEIQTSPLNTNASATIRLTTLQQQIASFTALANRYRPNLDSQDRRIQKLAAIKVAFKSEKFKKYRDSLHREKINLMLWLQLLL